MEFLRKWRKAILPCAAPLLCILGLAGCSRDAPERIRSQLSMPENTTKQEEHPGVQVSAQGMIYIPYAMIDAVFLEYSDNVILPEDYDETKTYPLVMTLPGYNGMWLSDSEQTQGVNLIADRGAVAWTQQGEDVIVVAPQFTDWGNTAARQAIALTEYFIENYSVDQNRIYAAGFSAGGEIMSRVMGMRAELFAAFLHYGSKWSGDYDAAIKNRLPICIYMMEDDEYYGPEQAREAYNALCSRYREAGLAEEEIAELVSLHIPDREFLSRWGFADFYMGGHMGGQMAVNDQTVMEWIMKQSK